MVIYFTRYDRGKPIRMLSVYCHELVGKVEEHNDKIYLMVDDNILGKVLDKMKKIIDI